MSASIMCTPVDPLNTSACSRRGLGRQDCAAGKGRGKKGGSGKGTSTSGVSQWKVLFSK
jgi:hypothetical protein